MSEAEKKTNNRVIYGLAKGEGRLTATAFVRTPLSKSILNILNGEEGSVERLAFEVDPSLHSSLAGVYQPKTRGIPDDILKRIAVQDSLVSNIVRARQNHIGVFGHPRHDRFSVGFTLEPNTGIIDTMDDGQKKTFNDEIDKAVRLIYNCGHTHGMADHDKLNFSECLVQLARNAVVNGRIAIEIIKTGTDNDKKFHHFAPIDAGTIYKATENNDAAQSSLREGAYHTLCQVTGKKLIKEKFLADEYRWIQVIAGRPYAAFTSDEVKTYNFYAVPDVEWNGYPVTPIDTVITSITTHINIVNHNRLYFQSGRAARGMLVITSDDINPSVIGNIKQQFNASINSTNNAFRMPVFGCGTGDQIQWQPIDSGGGKDMEFQYLTDMNAREILTAFMMSPDELPGWSYLSRGTSNQALSEGNQEYKLTAARDVGIRPLLQGFEDFFNTNIMGLINLELSKKVKLRFVGLDADNAEKEAVRLQQDMSIWETYDGLMKRVERDPLGADWGGSLPFNPNIKGYIDQYFTVGEILEKFCGRQNASKDPNLAYRRDQYFFQWIQIQQAQQQQAMAQQQQQAMAQQQGQAEQQGGQAEQQGGQAEQQGGSNNPEQTENQKNQAAEQSSASGGAEGAGNALARSIDQALDSLTKSEKDLPPGKRRILAQQKKTVEHFLHGWEEDSKHAIKEILEIAEHHGKKR